MELLVFILQSRWFGNWFLAFPCGNLHSVRIWISYLLRPSVQNACLWGQLAPGMSVHVRNATAVGPCTTKTDNDNRAGAAFIGFSRTTNGALWQPLDKVRQPWSRLSHWYSISSHLRSVLNHSARVYCHLEGNSVSILIYGFGLSQPVQCVWEHLVTRYQKING